MLGKIKRIKGLGLVFSDYSWDVELSNFKAVNLIYGWNGCGKTTLTRLFDHLSGISEDGVEFEIEDDSGASISQSDKFERPVRVFNHQYVHRNVRVLDARAERIAVVLGEESQEMLTKIAEHETPER